MDPAAGVRFERSSATSFVDLGGKGLGLIGLEQLADQIAGLEGHIRDPRRNGQAAFAGFIKDFLELMGKPGDFLQPGGAARAFNGVHRAENTANEVRIVRLSFQSQEWPRRSSLEQLAGFLAKVRAQFSPAYPFS